ncbi:helix-turn-helix domain-containing protein [Rhizobacter sp. OV335]|jgi:transcriptional regulator with XRE-family HTH domain|uniref:helix-turn-helix domain-containing protein n=1 Tax=Rhizobacter sp. OV335 TaxID=1500264 RepID=UPI000937D373|nr:helix-turn-helix transcriptional regulator [Rhizobacter sp. OV335]
MPRTIKIAPENVLLELLRSARERSGVTQVQLAERTGMRQTDISKSERGVRRLDVIELHEWLAALGVSFVVFAQELDERLTTMALLKAQQSRGVRRRTRKPD